MLRHAASTPSTAEQQFYPVFLGERHRHVQFSAVSSDQSTAPAGHRQSLPQLVQSYALSLAHPQINIDITITINITTNSTTNHLPTPYQQDEPATPYQKVNTTLRGRPIGGDHDLLTDINDLQQEIVDEARCGGGESFARMLEALKANKKLSAEIEGAYFEKYEAGLRKLKDDLSMAILAEENEQDVDTLVEVDSPRKKNRSWDSPGTAEGSQAKRKESSESNDVASNVNHEDSDDMEGEGEGEDRNAANDDDEPIEITGPLGPISSNTPTPAPAPSPRASRPTVRMLWGLTDPADTPPGGEKHPRDSPDVAEGSKAKRNKSSRHNNVASDVNHQGSDDVEGEGEDRNPADDDVERPNIFTRPISSSTPAPAPAPTPRVSRTAVHVYHGV
ncbi:hypothetical protein Q7P36_000065 [Cladosporium allicinum]